MLMTTEQEKKPVEGDQLQCDRNDKSRKAQEIYTKSLFYSFQMTIFLVVEKLHIQ